MAGICLKGKSGWERVTFIFHASLPEFSGYKWRNKGQASVFQGACWRAAEEALKLTDNQVILVACFVIPGAISVHLHTLLFPFARRFI